VAWEGSDCAPIKLAISILLIRRSTLGTESSGGLLSQQGDSAIPREIFTGEKYSRRGAE